MVVRAERRDSFDAVRDVVNRLLLHERFADFCLDDRSNCRLQIDFILEQPTPVDFDSLSESTVGPQRFEFGVDGLRIVHGEKRRYFLPGDALVWSILGLNQMRRHIEKLFPGQDVRDLTCFRFRSLSCISCEQSWLPLYRGLPPVREVAVESLYKAARAGVAWIVKNRHNDGRFVYYYDPASNSHRDHEHPQRDPDTNPYYNLLRHCGGVITLLYYGGLINRWRNRSDSHLASDISATHPFELEEIGATAREGIEFFDKQLVPYALPNKSMAAYAYFNQKAKLGGSGIGLYMLAQYQKLFNDDCYAQSAEMLAHHLLNQIKDTGEFMYYHIYLGRQVAPEENHKYFSFYYPGEAIIGLANYCQLVCKSEPDRSRIYARIHDALRFLVLQRPKHYREHYTTLPADSWLMMGINDLWDITEFQDKLYAAFVFHDADAMVAHMYTEENAPYPDYVGSFYYRFGDHPYPDGARAEGLLAAYMLALKIGDTQRIDRYFEALRRVAWALLHLCNTPESVYSVANPAQSIGGIRFKFTRQWFRVDTIQHVASFYLKFLPYLLPCAAGSPIEQSC
jgi:hypothetical protein